MDGKTVGELGSYGITAEAAASLVRALNFLETAGHEMWGSTIIRLYQR